MLYRVKLFKISEQYSLQFIKELTILTQWIQITQVILTFKR